MAFDAKSAAAEIVRLVGGKENINSVAHCMTRLRFVVKDLKKADQEALKKVPGVLGVIYAGGQLMVVLGKNLLPVYETVVKDFDLLEGAAVNENLDAPAEKKPLTLKSAGVAEGGSAADHAGQCGLCRYCDLRSSERSCRCAVLLYAHLCGLWRCEEAGRNADLLHDVCRCSAAWQVYSAGGRR